MDDEIGESTEKDDVTGMTLRELILRQGEAYRKEWSVISNKDDVQGRVKVTREEWVLWGG